MSENERMTNTVEYKRIVSILQELDKHGIVEKFNGNCHYACEVIQDILHAHDINSKIVECQVVISNSKKPLEPFKLLGYDNLKDNRKSTIDTHTVLVVQTDVPMIIDASIGYLLGNAKTVILDPMDNKDPEIFCTSQHNDYSIVYRVKKNIKLPSVHNKNILERIIEETKMQKEFGLIRKLATIAIVFGLVNFTLNFVLVILKVMFP